MPAKNANGSTNENFAAALAEVSERLTLLVHEEIELAKAEVAQTARSLARGAAAVAAGAVFGVFAVIFLLLTLAWTINGIFVNGAGSLWLGFLVVLVVLVVLTVGAFMFAWKKLSVGAPTPKLAISEGRKIKDTVTSLGGGQDLGSVTPDIAAHLSASMVVPTPPVSSATAAAVDPGASAPTKDAR